jgi:cyclopropane-fatty-acyl-phospholipid synthase
MPSHELLLQFQDDLRVERSWALNGQHYARTLSAWLAQLDARRDEALAVLRTDGRSADEAAVLVAQWRLFLMATAQLWGVRPGSAWRVSHYRMVRR